MNLSGRVGEVWFDLAWLGEHCTGQDTGSTLSRTQKSHPCMIARAIGPGAESHAALPPSGPFGISSCGAVLAASASCAFAFAFAFAFVFARSPPPQLPTPTKRLEPRVWFGLIWSGLDRSDLILITIPQRLSRIPRPGESWYSTARYCFRFHVHFQSAVWWKSEVA
ncbi:hypothetical protein N7509_000888 [Penicillium cosmopolitanum]|uniref:Uncharacterized protein n=1 Tax=Penicillium cosmopolitanum TaxID=1131564 RepID=A0A9W9WB47_9EURO|nr:uncharacterized protein N7509_000888 [Penicillium cosmopolitanum]KAJ5414261.1 hypothetical protein N7509_000888 [Penicillium cosmopolitanum]